MTPRSPERVPMKLQRLPVRTPKPEIPGGDFIRDNAGSDTTEFPTAPRLGKAEEETATTNPPSWPGVMGGEARWLSKKSIAAIPGRDLPLPRLVATAGQVVTSVEVEGSGKRNYAHLRLER